MRGTCYVQRMKFNSSKGEEAEDSLYHRLGNTNHAGGERGADSSAHELAPSENAAREDEQGEDGGETGRSRRQTHPDLGRLPHHHGHGEEYGERVEAVHMEHFHCRAMVQF